MTARTVRIVLALSLVLNIFLIGAAVGGAAWLHARRPLVAGSLRAAGAELPRPERRGFRLALRDGRMAARPAVLAGRQARARIAEQLRAPVLDQPALTAALADARTADVAVRTSVEASAVTYLATLPPADRTLLAEAMTRRGRR